MILSKTKSRCRLTVASMRCFAKYEQNMGERIELVNLIEAVVRPERSMSESATRVYRISFGFIFL